MASFTTTRRIEFCETDMAGICHFANFFRFMESAEVDFLHSLGLSVRMRWENEEIGFPRVSASCDYHSPAKFEDVLAIAVILDSIGRKSVKYRFEFARDGQPIATGKIACVCCRVTEHGIESIEIPPKLRRLLENQE